MRILVVSDVESKKYWDHYEKGMFDNIDLILSCGDLSPHYLSFLVTMGRAPVLYVRGNHDSNYESTPPEGCICIEDMIYNYKGLRILGLGGSMKYRISPNMYTEKEMEKRVRKLWKSLKWNHGFDILLAHSPAYHINDAADLPHQGFKVFTTLMDKYEPHYFLHGHIHSNYGSEYKREDVYHNTKIINAYDSYILDYPDELLSNKKPTVFQKNKLNKL